MKRIARIAVVPAALSAVLLGAGAASASTAAPDGGMSTQWACSGTFSSGGATVTVRCSADSPGSEFRAVAACPSGETHVGPWVPQGGDHVSVATCGNPMVNWGFDLR